MSLFNSCYFCLQSKQHNENLLCENCVNKFSDYKFYCCPRCSKFDCSGCTHLSEFKSIFCLYSYNSIISKIIVGAKDKFNINFQMIFEEIFYFYVKTELEKILEHKNYSAIILSPYNKARMFHGYWHPNLFFEKILIQIKEKSSLKFKILNPHYTTKKSTNVYGALSLCNIIKDQIDNTQHVLLCDDVLTTGASALKCLNGINKNLSSMLDPAVKPRDDTPTTQDGTSDMQAETPNTRPNTITWDLFTIFRSPQK